MTKVDEAVEAYVEWVRCLANRVKVPSGVSDRFHDAREKFMDICRGLSPLEREELDRRITYSYDPQFDARIRTLDKRLFGGN